MPPADAAEPERTRTFAQPPAPGDGTPVPTAFADRYRDLEPVGAGGFKAVFRAQDAVLDRTVALLRPHPRFADGGSAAQYLAEARILARLGHPHVLPVYDFGFDADGRCFVAALYAAGGSLADRLKAGPLPPGEAVGVALAVTDALEAARLGGLVHRDVKPDNVLFDAGGRAYLADFGLAASPAEAGGGAGTPAYMSPEQVGRDQPLDARSDLFSLGVLLYEVLCGTRPDPDGAGVGIGVRLYLDPDARPAAPSVRNPAVPEALDRVVARLLAREPADRFPTPGDLADELRAWRDGGDTTRAPDAGEVPLALPPWRLRVVAGPDAGRTFALDRPRPRVGRSRDCDVTLGDPAVSRFHFALSWSPGAGAFVPADLDPSRPVAADGLAATPAAEVRPGTRLTLGSSELVMELYRRTRWQRSATPPSTGCSRPWATRLWRTWPGCCAAGRASPRPPPAWG